MSPQHEMIDRPTLLLDKGRCLANIHRMAEICSQHSLSFRPHFKTHQSLEVGRWFRPYDVEKIAVSSVSMAEYFAEDWDDIMIAIPTNLRELARIDQLAKKCSLHILIEHSELIPILAKALHTSITVHIEIDAGYGRTGVDSTEIELIRSMIEGLSAKKNLRFGGFVIHNGHSYDARSVHEIRAIHHDSMDKLNELKHSFPEAHISLGDTPACSTALNFGLVDELRPGNFVFYDLTQLAIGSCQADDIAVAVACPIIAIYPDRHEIIVNAGGIHLSKDRLGIPGIGDIYGQLADMQGHHIGSLLKETYVKKLSQEHGTIHVPNPTDYRRGQLVYILPVHSCMVVDLMPYYLCAGERIEIFKHK